MKIAILGASGSVGGWVSQRLLEAGQQPRLIVRNSLGNRLSRRNNLDVRRCNFLDVAALTEALHGVDAVINCVIDKNPAFVEADLVPQNVKVLRSIVHAAASAKISTFVHVSSIVVKPPRLSEDTRKNVWQFSTERDWYSRAKIATEEFLRQTHLPFAWTMVRAGIITGPESGWSTLGFGASKDIICLPENVPSLCHVVDIDDFSRLLIHLAQRRVLPPIIYGINPEIVTWEHFYRSYAGAVDAELMLIKLPRSELEAHAQRPSFKQELLPWGAKSPIISRAIRSPIVFKLAKAVVLRMGWQFLLDAPPQVISGSRTISWPGQFRLEQYLSDAKFSSEETGATDGFTYRMSFQESLAWAAKWWRAEKSIDVRLPSETQQLFRLARRAIR